MKRAREVDDPARPPADDAVSYPVDEASALSFPASDPPGWIVVHPGQPAAPAESGGPDRSPVRRRFSNPPGSSGS